MSRVAPSNTPMLLWPFAVIWALLGLILRTVGRIICALLGLGLMAAGVALTLTVVGAVAGVPLAAFGFLLLVRAVF